MLAFHIRSKFVSNIAYCIVRADLFQFKATNKISNRLPIKSLISAA